MLVTVVVVVVVDVVPRARSAGFVVIVVVIVEVISARVIVDVTAPGVIVATALRVEVVVTFAGNMVSESSMRRYLDFWWREHKFRRNAHL